jgi:hypothetical protein
MKKSGKHLSGFFLWIAILAIIAHGIIPHDHHSGIICAHQEEPCPASGSESGHHSEYPIHCHALNDITAEKIVNYISISVIQHFNVFIPLFSDDFSINPGASYLTVPDFRKPFRDPYLIEFSSLRAPPALG